MSFVKALKESEGWKSIDSSYDAIRNESGQSLKEAGAIAVRYTCDKDDNHVSIVKDIENPSAIAEGFSFLCVGEICDTIKNNQPR